MYIIQTTKLHNICFDDGCGYVHGAHRYGGYHGHFHDHGRVRDRDRDRDFHGYYRDSPDYYGFLYNN